METSDTIKVRMECVDDDGHCVTCSDEALECEVIEISADAGTARVVIDGKTIEVDISFIDIPEIGDRLLIHGGVALLRL